MKQNNMVIAFKDGSFEYLFDVQSVVADRLFLSVSHVRDKELERSDYPWKDIERYKLEQDDLEEKTLKI